MASKGPRRFFVRMGNESKTAGITRPGPGEQGNTGRNYFIGPRQFNTDASLSKKFRFNERVYFDLRVDAKNLTNSPTFGLSDAAMLFTSASVGQINNTVLIAITVSLYGIAATSSS